MRILVALGGNAITGPNDSVEPKDQIAAVEEAASQIADLVAAGNEVVLSHGNGPQVGAALKRNEIAAAEVAPTPLDWCVADTQGALGYILLNALHDAFAKRGLDTEPTVLVTRALVDKNSDAFKNPTKPVGGYLTQSEAQVQIAAGQSWIEIEPNRWRRVVPSPEPQEILDAPAVDVMLAAGMLVIAGGGGGIPVAYRADGTLEGVEAVIDKDLSSQLLAQQVKADALVIATNVDNAWVNWGREDGEPIFETDLPTLRKYAEEGQFAAGSMGPKVAAIMEFVEGGGPVGIITALDKITVALTGEAGTTLRN